MSARVWNGSLYLVSAVHMLLAQFTDFPMLYFARYEKI